MSSMSKRELSRIMFTLLLLLFITNAFSQKRYELSVKEAVELAFKNVTDIKNAQLDYEIQNAQNKEITGQALPQLLVICSSTTAFTISSLFSKDW